MMPCHLGVHNVAWIAPVLVGFDPTTCAAGLMSTASPPGPPNVSSRIPLRGSQSNGPPDPSRNGGARSRRGLAKGVAAVRCGDRLGNAAGYPTDFRYRITASAKTAAPAAARPRIGRPTVSRPAPRISTARMIDTKCFTGFTSATR